MKQAILNHFNGSFKTYYEKHLPKFNLIGGDEHQALCPFHEDKNPSLNFNNQTGRYYCHGCGKKGDIFHFAGKINGLDTRRDFRKILKGIADDFGIPWEQKKSHMVKAYNYTDADGKLLFQVCRMEPKDFRQRRPNGNGGWIWSLKDKTKKKYCVEPVLYHLPEIIKSDEVIIVEGEKDADNLSGLGFPATTAPMGAKKWRESYNECLKGKNIILIPDNDQEGLEHMAKVGASLNGNVASLKLLQLPELPSKGDVSDFISQIKDKEIAAERLALMIDNAGPYEPPKKLSLEDVITDINEFCENRLPARETYLHPWIKESSILLISGYRGIGKTFFAMSIADAVSDGASFGPWKCETPVPVLFLDGEMPPQDITDRARDLKLNRERQQPLYIYCDAMANQNGLPRAHLGSEKWRTKMKSILLTRKVKLWIIDNLASLASGIDENKKQDWDPINQWLLELRFAGISSIMMHHVNKDGGQRGTSAREDNLDVSLMLKKPPDFSTEDGARFIAHFSKSRVKTSHLNLIADTEFKLMSDEVGSYIWTFGNFKQERKREVLKMIDEGSDYKTIAETLDISKPYITKVKQQAIKAEYMTESGKLTQTGFTHVSTG